MNEVTSNMNPYAVLGWAHAEFCNMLDRGEDPRVTPVPNIVERMAEDLGFTKEQVQSVESLGSDISFGEALVVLMNVYGLENDSDTPDFILANYLEQCLETFNRSVNARCSWYAHGDRDKVAEIMHRDSPDLEDLQYSGFGDNYVEENV